MRATGAAAFTVLPRNADVVFEAGRDVVAAEHQAKDTRSADRALSFTAGTGTTASDGVPLACRLEVSQEDAGAVVHIECATSGSVEGTRVQRRRARRTTRRVLGAVIDAVEARPPSDSEDERFGKSRARHRFLARLTGRRAWVASVVLLAAYALPLGLSWAIVRTYESVPRETASWVVPMSALTAGLALGVALTLRFGGWFQAVAFGEEYPVTFGLVPGFLLGFWRLALQLACLALVPLIAFSVQEQADLDAISNAETRGLKSYSRGVPVPRGWVETGSGSVEQNTYADWPNATFNQTYLVPGSYTLADVEAWLNDPRWAQRDGATRPIGRLRDITCDSNSNTCEAAVTPSPGEPAEYTVEATLTDASYTASDRPELTQQVRFALRYENADA